MNWLWDVMAVVVSVLVVGGYQVWWLTYARRVGQSTVHAINMRVRRRWVEIIMRSKRQDVLAVQTFRNSVMASSFMASTAILLLMAVMSFLLDANRLHSFSAVSLGPQGEVQSFVAAKLMLIALDLFIAFFLFATSVRFFTHAGYLVSATESEEPTDEEIADTAGYVNRAGRLFSLGLRTFFMIFPLVFWLFGPLPLLFASLALTYVLYMLDQSPHE